MPYNKSDWRSYGYTLIHAPGSRVQKKFLHMCRNGGEEFVQHIRDEVKLNQEFSLRDSYEFTHKEFRCPPFDVQKDFIWKNFKKITPVQACSTSFWCGVTLGLIEHGCIKPHYLAATMNVNGKRQLDGVLNPREQNNDKSVDDLVRRVLRSMCNPAPRGARVVLVDCPLGITYWRWNWAEEFSSKGGGITNLTRSQILEVLDPGAGGAYSLLAEKIFSGKSYIGAENILGGIIIYLHRKKNIRNRKEVLERIVKGLGIIMAKKAIDRQTPEENANLIGSLF